MRFGELIRKLAIPYWRACYINYDLLKKLLKVFIGIYELKELLKDNNIPYTER
jgi:SPX domain protein involved in polyphosphate accumulation